MTERTERDLTPEQIECIYDRWIYLGSFGGGTWLAWTCFGYGVENLTVPATFVLTLAGILVGSLAGGFLAGSLAMLEIAVRDWRFLWKVVSGKDGDE